MTNHPQKKKKLVGPLTCFFILQLEPLPLGPLLCPVAVVSPEGKRLKIFILFCKTETNYYERPSELHLSAKSKERDLTKSLHRNILE